MYFELSVTIQRPPSDVFLFLRDKDTFQQEEGSPVLLIEKTTSGPTGVGTRYREIVQMLPFYQGELRSQITRYEPYEWLEEDFDGPGMKGHLTYQFLPMGNATRLIQRETIHVQGILKIIAPFIRRSLAPRLKDRLEYIKEFLESETTRSG